MTTPHSVEDALVEGLVSLTIDDHGQRRTALEVLLVAGFTVINRQLIFGGAPSPGLGTEPIIGADRVLLVGDVDPDAESLRRAALHAAAMRLAHATIRDVNEAAEVAYNAALRAELRVGLPACSRPGEAELWAAMDDFAPRAEAV